MPQDFNKEQLDCLTLLIMTGDEVCKSIFKELKQSPKAIVFVLIYFDNPNLIDKNLSKIFTRSGKIYEKTTS